MNQAQYDSFGNLVILDNGSGSGQPVVPGTDITVYPGTDTGGGIVNDNPVLYTPVIPVPTVEPVNVVPNTANLIPESVGKNWGVWLLLAAGAYAAFSKGKYKKYNIPVMIAGGLGFTYFYMQKKKTETVIPELQTN